MGKKDVKLFIILIVFTVCVHLLIIPVLTFKQEKTFLRSAFFIVHNFLAFLVYLYIFLIKRKDGFVPYSNEMSELLRETPFRYCEICDNYKPERSHHCSKCKRCVKKMDHHCRWLLVCINYANLGHFIRLLFFGILDLILVGSFSCYSLYTLQYKEIDNIMKIRFIVFCMLCIILLSGFAAGLLGLFFKERFSFLLKNITFIEHSDLEDYRGNEGLKPEDSPYNLGWQKNLRIQMGPPYFLYLFGESCDGLNFEKRFECDYWPPVRRKPRRLRNFHNN